MATQKTIRKEQYRLEESISAIIEGEGSKAKGVLNDVAILGMQSKNGNRYTEGYMQSAPQKYEGAKIYINHQTKEDRGNGRRIEDLYGKAVGVYYDKASKRLKARRFEFNPKHRLAEQLIWQFENAPETIGFSHDVVAIGHKDKDTKEFVAESVKTVYSVDLVTDPATVHNLYEQHANNETAEELQEQINELQERLNALKPSPERSKKMDMKELQESHPELVKQILEQASSNEKQKELAEELRALKEENAQYKAKAEEAAKKQKLQEQCKEAGLNSAQISEAFINLLVKCNSDEEVKEAIEDRKALAPVSSQGDARRGSQQLRGPAGDFTTSRNTEGNGASLHFDKSLDKMDVKDFMEATNRRW
jgi:hypothetical protein